MAQQIDKPTELHNENLPPTQSHIGKILSSVIPKFTAFSMLEETATKCFSMSN